MKKWVFAPLFIGLLVSLSGCGVLAQQKEFLAYVNKVDAFNKEKEAVSNEFQDKYNNEKNFDQAVNALQTDIIPKYKKLKDEVDSYHSDNKEIQTVHNSYKKLIDEEYDVYEDYLTATKDNNQDLFKTANQKVDELNKDFPKFEQELTTLSKKYKVDLSIKE